MNTVPSCLSYCLHEKITLSAPLALLFCLFIANPKTLSAQRATPELACSQCTTPPPSGGVHTQPAPTPTVTYPTFLTSHEYTNVVMAANNSFGPAVSTDLYSPSAVSCGGMYWLAYTDDQGDLQIYENNSPTSLSNYSTLNYNIGAPGGTHVSMACSNGQLVFAYNPGNGTINYFFINMVTKQTAQSTGSISQNSIMGDPAIEDVNGTLYTAYVCNTPGNYNGLTYPQVYVASGMTTSGSFIEQGNLATGSQQVYYPAASSPSLSQLNGSLAIVWLTGSNQNPVVVIPPVSYSSATAANEINMTTGIMLGGSPAAVNFNNTLFIFGRSYYSADNLWAIGTLDGVNFAAQHEYGQSLRGVPSLAVFDGALAQAGRSNYSNDLWIYTTTY